MQHRPSLLLPDTLDRLICRNTMVEVVRLVWIVNGCGVVGDKKAHKLIRRHLLPDIYSDFLSWNGSISVTRRGCLVPARSAFDFLFSFRLLELTMNAYMLN